MSTDADQPGASGPRQDSSAMPFLPSPREEEHFYELENEEPAEGEEGNLFTLGNAAPFQVSGAMPVVNPGKTTQFATPPPASTRARRTRRRRSLYLIIALSTVAVMLLLTLVMTAFPA